MEVDWEAAKTAPGDALVNSLAMLLPFERWRSRPC